MIQRMKMSPLLIRPFQRIHSQYEHFLRAVVCFHQLTIKQLSQLEAPGILNSRHPKVAHALCLNIANGSHELCDERDACVSCFRVSLL